jgi:vacuolar-type H+-ATPase subunit H
MIPKTFAGSALVSDVLEGILQAERQAELLVQQAREKQRRSLQAAEQETDRRLQKARAASQRHMSEAMEKARKEADDRYQKAMREAEIQSEKWKDHESEQLNRIVDGIVEIIARPEVERKEAK